MNFAPLNTWDKDPRDHLDARESKTGNNLTALDLAKFIGDTKLVDHLAPPGAKGNDPLYVHDYKAKYESSLYFGILDFAPLNTWDKDPRDHLDARESKTGNKWTALHLATHIADHKLVDHLCRNGALPLLDINNKYPHQVSEWTAEAKKNSAYSGQFAKAKEIALKIHKALQEAASKHHKALFANLLKHTPLNRWGKDPRDHPNARESRIGHNWRAGNDWTALHLATHIGEPKLVDLLYQNGALPSLDIHGKYPHQVPSSSNPAYSGQLAEAKAVALKHYNALYSNLLKHAPLNTWNKDPRDHLDARENHTGNRWTPLHLATHIADLKLVNLLCHNGALIMFDRKCRQPHQVPSAKSDPAYLRQFAKAKEVAHRHEKLGHRSEYDNITIDIREGRCSATESDRMGDSFVSRLPDNDRMGGSHVSRLSDRDRSPRSVSIGIGRDDRDNDYKVCYSHTDSDTGFDMYNTQACSGNNWKSGGGGNDGPSYVSGGGGGRTSFGR